MKTFMTAIGTSILIVSLGVNLFLITSGKKQSSIYPLLATRIQIENPNDVIVAFNPLRKKLREEALGWGDSFAFFFEYLPTGITIGVNEKNNFDLASLLKVPYVMAYYLQQQHNGLSINPIATIQAEDIDDRFGNLWQQGIGHQIPLQDVIKLTLVHSDDTAVRILKRYVSRDAYQEVYDGLDIELTQAADNPPTLSAKSYTSILKALYFSSILTKVQSQEILNLLTQTPFDDKLAAGVPDGISIAHKIGVIQDHTYSDCGIIYLPQRQYILCMISQSTESEARRRMQRISGEIYEYLSTYSI